MEEKLKLELRKLCRHKEVMVTERGNQAILIAMQELSKKGNKVLIPEEGGWFSYKKYPKLFGLEIVEVKCNKSLIDLEDLKNKVKGACGFIFSSFGGYFVEQDLEKISSICREADCLVVEDASGAIGDSVLCNGEFSDIILGSFGRWKPVNCGYGGWISSNFKIDSREALSLSKVYPGAYSEIYSALEKNKVSKLLELASKVKEDLKDFEIFHREKRGVNVVVAYDEKVLDYCKEKGYEFVICPKYIRVNEKAISIELKRLDL
jgi:hypothetical protein